MINLWVQWDFVCEGELCDEKTEPEVLAGMDNIDRADWAQSRTHFIEDLEKDIEKVGWTTRTFYDEGYPYKRHYCPACSVKEV
jgi:hypothetical protein